MTHFKFSALLVDDDADVLDSYAHLMSIANIPAKCVQDPTQACNYIDADWEGVAIIDMYMPKLNGMDLLERIKSIDGNIPVVVITGHGDIPMAVEAVKKGASDFLEKPINPPVLLDLIKKHLGIRQEYIQQKQTITQSIKAEIIGHSAQIELIRSHVAQLAMLNSHIAIVGESGTGRRSLAHLIHQLGNRSENTFIQYQGSALQCQSEAEHALAKSANGTLLITQIDLIPENIQYYLSQELLRQERSNKNHTRLIAIFNEDPEMLIKDQRLNPELYYLVSQGNIDVPSLRKRPDDIATLFHYFLKQSCVKLAKPVPTVDTYYLNTLRHHTWPGNVRELRNVAELYAIGIVKLAGQNRISNQDVLTTPLDDLVDDYEKQVIEDALFLYSGKVSEAANYLQVPRKKLYLRMKKHGIEKDKFKTRS
ncbi:sigma-54-dependent transcriptional regulator [Vibrio penaeicida]|uniref:Sigma-54-dependent Fis family transcriptional regulator n=1 Tax=Vibrio penaeicida TaxID=104609 RepID=A0AAV5NLY5_9VIBR|nr:sigma-54 dependent transcriptional regulator [Vibrio penaeicida]RTZ19307.1 sigma-54-dependent Fis family transcriptional regulator [Vibrio penaeicida]GLQ71258.1 sigma-54-dependent Fis family transcriptional regulator [Vibrio penaeicida]